MLSNHLSLSESLAMMLSSSMYEGILYNIHSVQLETHSCSDLMLVLAPLKPLGRHHGNSIFAIPCMNTHGKRREKTAISSQLNFTLRLQYTIELNQYLPCQRFYLFVQRVLHLPVRVFMISVQRGLSAKAIFQVFPLHEPEPLRRLQKTWVQSVLNRQPIGGKKNNSLISTCNCTMMMFSDDICDYFGIKIAFYFSWLGHYTTALCIPAAVGFLVWVKLELQLPPSLT